MRAGVPLVVVLLVTLVALVALAHASPPDPTWIGGFYDDADYDDVVLAAAATTGTLEVTPLEFVEYFPVTPLLCPAPAAGAASPVFPALQPRAPPTA